MEARTARLTLLIDPNKKAAFELLCARQDRTVSQVVRQLIRDYLAHHGVDVRAGDALQGKPARPKGGTGARALPGTVRRKR